MTQQLEPGTYVVAVSGGVDSMALLHWLVSQEVPDTRWVVAHLDHGIREDSAEDRRLVQEFSRAHGLPFVYHEAALGEQASENTARQARYDFLHKVREATGARGIMTAHHYDDALETAVHNLLRGTGRKGISSLHNTPYIVRPFLGTPKAVLKDYAQTNGLQWREDSTNSNLAYRRNYIRHRILPRLTDEQKATLHAHLERVRELNQEIDQLLATHLHMQPAINRLDRKQFIALPHVVAREVMAAWLRNNGIRRFDRRLLEQLVTAAKTLRIGKFMSIDGTHSLSITKEELALVSRDRYNK